MADNINRETLPQATVVPKKAHADLGRVAHSAPRPRWWRSGLRSIGS
jgi:hypothetical protein